MEKEKVLKGVSSVINVLAVVFAVFLILITVVFVSARNNHGMITVLSVGYFSDEDNLYTVTFTEEFKADESNIGKTVAYEDENDGMLVKAGVIASIETVREYELPKIRMADGSVVKTKNVIGTVSGKTGAGFFNAITTKTGYMLTMCIPGILFIVYYFVAIILHYRKKAFSDDPPKGSGGKKTEKSEEVPRPKEKAATRKSSVKRDKDKHDDIKESF